MTKSNRRNGPKFRSYDLHEIFNFRITAFDINLFSFFGHHNLLDSHWHYDPRFRYLKYLASIFCKFRRDFCQKLILYSCKESLTDRLAFEFGLKRKGNAENDHQLVNSVNTNRRPLTLEINYTIN